MTTIELTKIYILSELKNCKDMLAGQEAPNDSDALFCKSLVKQMTELTLEQSMRALTKIQ